MSAQVKGVDTIPILVEVPRYAAVAAPVFREAVYDAEDCLWLLNPPPPFEQAYAISSFESAFLEISCFVHDFIP